MLAQKVMTHRGRWLIAILAILAISVAVLAQQGKKIDDNALKNAAKNKEEWISYNRDWSETRYSPLDQINATNVSKLGLAWSLDIPNVGTGNPPGSHESGFQRRSVQHHTIQPCLCGGRAHRQDALAVRSGNQSRRVGVLRCRQPWSGAV